MSFLDSLGDFFTTKEGRAMDQVAQMNALKIQDAQAQQEQAKAAAAARAKLLGIADPYTGITWNQPPVGPSANTQVQQPGGGFADVSNNPQSLMGAGVSDTTMRGLLGGADQFSQAQMVDRQRLRTQADPDSAMFMDRLNSFQGGGQSGAMNKIPPEVIAGGPEAVKAYLAEVSKKAADAAYPVPPENMRMIDGLKAKVAQFGPGTPEAKPYEDALTKLNYVPDMDPLNRQEKLASIAGKQTQSDLDRARIEQIHAGNVDPDTLTDLAARYIQTGDKTLFTTLGKGTQGSANLARFQGEVTKQLAAQGKSQRDIEMAQNGIKTAGATLTDFAKGKNGQLVRTANTSVSHLLTLEKLGEALDNGDVNAVNTIKNTLSGEFGGADISGYEAAAKVVGDEVNKFISGGPGAADDRAAYAKTLSSAKGPEARMAAINSLKGLLVGQLHSLQRQYANGTGLDDFGTKLEPDVAALLGNPQFAVGGNPTKTPTNPVAAVPPLPKPVNAPADAKPSPKDGKWYSPIPGKPGKYMQW